jgi:hypothetical protein
MNESSLWAILFVEEELARFTDDRMDLEWYGELVVDLEVYE